MASRPRTSRRRWSDTFKKRVVAEVSQPGVTVAQIAHRYDLDANRISNWKTKFGGRRDLGAGGSHNGRRSLSKVSRSVAVQHRD